MGRPELTRAGAGHDDHARPYRTPTSRAADRTEATRTLATVRQYALARRAFSANQLTGTSCSSACARKHAMLVMKLSKATPPAIAAVAVCDSPQLASDTTTAITAMTFKNSPSVAMASAIPPLLMASRLPASGNVETFASNAGAAKSLAIRRRCLPAELCECPREGAETLEPDGRRRLLHRLSRGGQQRHCPQHAGMQ